MVIEDRLRTFIADEIRTDGQRELSDDYPLIERGLLDSMGVLNLVSFIESEFGVEIQDEELVSENFGTIAGMARLVDSKRGASR